MSTEAMVDAVLRLTGADGLTMGESLLITALPNGSTQVLRLRVMSTAISQQYPGWRTAGQEVSRERSIAWGRELELKAVILDER